jgi:hypothetical protein
MHLASYRRSCPTRLPQPRRSRPSRTACTRRRSSAVSSVCAVAPTSRRTSAPSDTSDSTSSCSGSESTDRQVTATPRALTKLEQPRPTASTHPLGHRSAQAGMAHLHGWAMVCRRSAALVSRLLRCRGRSVLRVLRRTGGAVRRAVGRAVSGNTRKRLITRRKRRGTSEMIPFHPCLASSSSTCMFSLLYRIL